MGHWHWRVIGLACVLGLSLSACKPKYPRCDNDEDCRAKEFCVAETCRQCRQNADCPPGAECKGGVCGAAPLLATACADDSACPEGKSCIDGTCQTCQVDAECGQGGKCQSGVCLRSGSCQKDDDCPQHMDCVNGRCTADTKISRKGIPTDCTLGAVYFGFNEATVAPQSTADLQRIADCVKRSPVPVELVGHADPRGTDEYNLALSERRAFACRDYLERLGVRGAMMKTLPRGELDANGHNETTWARDRRVELRWQ